MDWDRFGIFSIVVFLFYAVFKCFSWTISTPLSYMFIDDGARSLKHWHDEL